MDYKVALVQGIYFLITGIWPILSMKTFLLITGPKTDLWLVKTVGLILAVIGAVVFYAQMTGTINAPVILLAIGSALGLALVEIIYVLKRVISPIYLADAFAEFILIAWWAIDLWTTQPIAWCDRHAATATATHGFYIHKLGRVYTSI